MKIDETLKNNLIADVENICNSALDEETITSLKRAFEITIGHHYAQPLPEQESTELTDLKQYVTNLLYAAWSKGYDEINASPGFDKWVEEQVNNLSEYYAQSQPVVTDDMIEKEFPFNESNVLISQPPDYIEKGVSLNFYRKQGAKWMRSKLMSIPDESGFIHNFYITD